MTIPVLVALIASIGCDVLGQVLFKTALDAPALDDATPATFVKTALRSPPLWGGVGAYAVEFVLWLWVLSQLPLSVAFPIASLAYVGVVVSSRVILGERVSRRRWAGVGLITLGVAIVGATGA